MMASVVVRGNRKKSLTLRGVDPETCMIVFKNHWAQVVKILEKHEPGRGTSRLGPIPADEASAVQNYVEHMLFLLMEEEAGQGAMGPILELVVLEGVMERLFLWSLRRQFTEDMKLEQLRMYQMLLSQARQPLLHHKPVLRPLMMLLASCAGAAELVLLLNQLCAALVKDPSVLELFFHTSEDQGAANFLLFSLLIPFTHRQGSVGQQARDSLLLIMSLSASEPRVAQHIAQNTYFCPVNTQTETEPTGWFWSCVCTLTSCFLSYHLWWVCQLTVEEVMTTTAYLDLFLRSVSEPALLQTFLSFILLHRHDNVHILDTLVSRVNTPFQLGTVSLALFRTLIGLFCEDVMLQLVFRYLLPCSHLSRRQRCSLQQTDCYSCSASSLLLLLPSWCPLHLRSGSQSEHIHWPRAPGECSSLCARSVGVGQRRLLSSLMFWFVLRACRFWSAPYDGVDPPPQQYRSDTPGGDVDEEEELVRTSSALELEWDDIFADEDSSAVINMALANGGVTMETDRFTVSPAPPPLPPRHIQEMRRSATRLVHGAYVEESEFQDDVLVYDLIAQKDTKDGDHELKRTVGPAEPAAGPAGRRNFTNGFNVKNHIIDEREDPDEGSETFKPNCNLSDCVNHTYTTQQQQRNTQRHTAQLATNALPNGHVESESRDLTLSNAKCPSLPDNRATSSSDLLSQYHELMLSLGVEPDCDDITDDISTFRKRVRALRQKLVEDEEELSAEFGFTSSLEDAEEEEEMEEEEEEEEEEERMKSGNVLSLLKSKHCSLDSHSPVLSHHASGPFISVLLSRLENLLENSIAVNLLVTGILAQLASYPQPLLRSFLLCTDQHQQPNVRTLHQVLESVHAQVERYVAARPDYPALLTQAWRFLLAKDQDDVLLDPSLPNGSLKNALPLPPLSVLPPCPSIPPQAKSRVFAIVLFAEFLKELAAIAQEHSIAPDWSAEE
uniref:Protein FAM160A1-like n=1 Tax=Stegastes partitus TaxID=144197 RepID=A0A3B5ALL2_9TELE